MAAELSIYFASVLTVNGVPAPDFGSIVTPVKGAEAAINDGSGHITREVRVPAGEMVTAWEWAQTEGFTALTLKIKGGEGTVQVAMRYNATTDGEDDLTPAVSISHWRDETLTCVGVYHRSSERAYIHATAATEVGDTASYPTVWSSGSRVLGVADLLAIYNEGDEDLVLELQVVPK